MIGLRLLSTAVAGALVLAACGKAPEQAATKESADEFVARINKELLELGNVTGAAAWVYATYITPDSELLAAKGDERTKAMLSTLIAQAKAYDGQTLKPETRRAIDLLKLGIPIPAPND